MSVKIAYNNTPSLVLLCENRVKLDPAGMLHDHAELTETQQTDPAVVSWCAQGKILLLSIDEAEKRELRRTTVVETGKQATTSVENPAAPPKVEAEAKAETKAEAKTETKAEASEAKVEVKVETETKTETRNKGKKDNKSKRR